MQIKGTREKVACHRRIVALLLRASERVAKRFVGNHRAKINASQPTQTIRNGIGIDPPALVCSADEVIE
jgi:hypothetical protein